MTIGQRIKSRRKELNLSVDELAKRLGKARATVYRYENGDIENLPLDILKPIADALEVEPAYLMGWKPDKKEKPAIDGELSEGQKALIAFARSIPEDKADLVLRVIKSIVESD